LLIFRSISRVCLTLSSSLPSSSLTLPLYPSFSMILLHIQDREEEEEEEEETFAV
jgi:hypothetical protein